MNMVICLRCLVIASLVFLTACAPKMVKMYDGPDREPSRIAVVRGIDPNVKIVKVDWQKVPSSWWSGYPTEVHLLPGSRSVFAAINIGPGLLWSSDSLIEFEAVAGQYYYVNYRHGDKLYFWLEDTRGNTLYKKDDLVKDIDEVINQYSNTYYKMNPQLRTDYFVSLVRQRMFEHPWTAKSAIVLMSFGLLNDTNFNCEQFAAKLTKDQKKDFDSKIEKYPFICRNRAYAEKDVLEAFKGTLKEKITTPQIADAHWAWYSATGNTDVLKLILDSYLYESDSCQDCIQWSYRSIAGQDKNVENYLNEYMRNKPQGEREKLQALLPSSK